MSREKIGVLIVGAVTHWNRDPTQMGASNQRVFTATAWCCYTPSRMLPARLQSEHQHWFAETQLRTVQSREKEWLGIMAKKLDCAGTGDAATAPSGLPELARLELIPGVKISVTCCGEATGLQESLSLARRSPKGRVQTMGGGMSMGKGTSG